MISKIKNIKISIKIQIIILFVSLISLIAITIFAYNSIVDITNFSTVGIEGLGKYSSDSSAEALKSQSEKYLLQISKSLSESSDGVLNKASEQVSTVVSSIEDIYKNSNNFIGSVPPLPDMTDIGNVENSASASDKAYVVDPKNREGSEILVYDPDEYPSKFKENIYRTNINEWISLSDEERNNLKISRNVVSQNVIPDSIREELKIISNLNYIVKPMYINNSIMSKIYLGTESGISYRYSMSASPERYDPRERPWYKRAVEERYNGNNKSVWLSTYIDKDTKRLCVTCSKAFLDSNGDILGVVALDMYLSDINKYISDVNIGAGAYTFVIDSDGKILMHPDYFSDDYGKILGENDTLFMYNPLSDNIDESYRNIINSMRNGEVGVSTAEINGKNYYTAYYPMESTGWSLGTVCGIEDIVAPSVELGNSINSEGDKTEGIMRANLQKLMVRFIIILAVCILSVFIVGSILSKSIVNPIERLEFNIEKMGKGDLDSKIPVDSEDEIGSLAQTFNDMKDKLQRYIDDLAQTTADKERIYSELSIAKRIQFSMLPCIFPAFPGRDDFDIYAMMDPAKEVGGDFYDFFFTDKNHLALVIADVSGKGISAALFMVIAKILIKNQAQTGSDPAEIFELVNNQLCENNEADMFVTSFIGILDTNTGEFVYSSAGHNPPLVYRKSGRKFEWINPKKGFVLGGIPNTKYRNNNLTLNKGDIIYMYTDGIVEAMNKDSQLFTADRLYSILNDMNIESMTLREIVKNIREMVDEFSVGTERADDITTLAFKNYGIPSEIKEDKI